LEGGVEGYHLYPEDKQMSIYQNAFNTAPKMNSPISIVTAGSTPLASDFFNKPLPTHLTESAIKFFSKGLRG
tara:strand:+ start:757 stop:972 length:216 start_codon:yes stop_codon:yes gene_type:complete